MTPLETIGYLLIGSGFANYLDSVIEDGIDDSLWIALTIGWPVAVISSAFVPKGKRGDGQ